MTITLYYAPRTKSGRARWMLEELGVAHELKLIDFDKGENEKVEYRRIHPLGEVPALVDDDVIVIDATAICMYLADRFPDRQMAPAAGSPDRGRYYQLLALAGNVVEPIVQTVFDTTVVSPDPQKSPPILAAAMKRWAQVGKALDIMMAGRAYCVAEKMSAADVILGSILMWAGQMDMLDDLPDLKSYAHYLASRTAYKKAAAGARPRFQLKTL
ncbi:MAG: glutathione S-transferase family protein [Polyangiaceae bacterium]|nr:glutathione S-transferase family protein [Polyangiaceae bacterium]